MAIQVNGTTVIDNSRQLTNVGGLKTVNGTSLVGSGNISAGASTTNGAVGTYGFMSPYPDNYFSSGNKTPGTQLSGSSLQWSAANNAGTTSNPSGTWQSMGYAWAGYSGSYAITLWQRIS